MPRAFHVGELRSSLHPSALTEGNGLHAWAPAGPLTELFKLVQAAAHTSQVGSL